MSRRRVAVAGDIHCAVCSNIYGNRCASRCDNQGIDSRTRGSECTLSCITQRDIRCIKTRHCFIEGKRCGKGCITICRYSTNGNNGICNVVVTIHRDRKCIAVSCSVYNTPWVHSYRNITFRLRSDYGGINLTRPTKRTSHAIADNYFSINKICYCFAESKRGSKSRVAVCGYATNNNRRYNTIDYVIFISA